MKRPLTPEEIRVWATVLATVEPGPGRVRPVPPEPPRDETRAASPPQAAAPAPSVPTPRPPRSVNPLEPGRLRRLQRGRDEVEARIDLHGFDQHSAWLALSAFLERAHRNRLRAVLVITGRGSSGGDTGVIRRRFPDWLSAHPMRQWVSGWSAAHRRHGGEGAFYVTIRRSGPAAPPLTPAP